MFKAILYLWVLLTISLFGIAIWFLINTIKKRFPKTKKIEWENENHNKYTYSNNNAPTEKGQGFEGKVEEREGETEGKREKEYGLADQQERVQDEVHPQVVLEEIVIQNIGDVDGDGKDDYIVQEHIVVAEEQANADEEPEILAQESEESSIQQNTDNETVQESDWIQEEIASRAHVYQMNDEPEEVETPKNISAAVNIAMWHSRDDIVRDKFEKHIQKIRYDATILKQRNDILGYEKKLVEWLTFLPNDIDFEKQLADLYFHQGKYKKAQSLLKKIIDENPEDHNALRQMWEISTEDKLKNDDAFAYLQQAYILCDDNPKYAYSLAQWYYDHQDFESALPLLEKVTKLRPTNIDYLVSLSHLQHKMWDREGAKNSILRALELDPMNVTLKNYLKSLL